MRNLAAVALVVCISCAPAAPLIGGGAPGRLGIVPAGYYEDESQAPRIALGVTLTCGVIAGFVVFWPDIDELFTSQLSTWFYGY